MFAKPRSSPQPNNRAACYDDLGNVPTSLVRSIRITDHGPNGADISSVDVFMLTLASVPRQRASAPDR